MAATADEVGGLRLVLLVYDLDTGGAQRVLLQLAEGWSSQGHDVTLVTFEQVATDRYPVPEGIERRSLENRGISKNVLHAVVNNGLRWWKLRRLLRQVKPDGVVAFMPEATSLAVLAAIGLGIPVVGSERNNPDHLELSRVHRMMVRFAYPRTSKIVALTHANADVLQRTVPCDLEVIGNSVSLPLPAFDPREAPGDHVPDTHKLVLSVGRLVDQKQMDHVVRAFAALPGIEADRWHLAILGRGPHKAELAALADRLGIADRFTIIDIVGNVQDWYERASVFVLSSQFEGFPNVLLEAMACGCAVTAYDCPTGPAELVDDGVNGFLVPLNDEAALTSRLAELCSDDGPMQSFAAAAERVVDDFSRSRFQNSWDDVLVDSFASTTPLVVAWVIKGLAHGGAEQIVADLSPLLQERGVRVVVLSTRRIHALQGQLEASGVEVRFTPRNPLWAPWLLRQLSRSEFAIVHTHSPVPAGFVSALGPLLRHSRRFPRWIVDTGHNDVAAYHPLTRFVNAHTKRWRDAVLATSEIARQGAPDEVVVHHGVAATAVPRRPEPVPVPVARIVSVAAFRPQKDHRTLLFAAAELRDACVDFELDLIGDGPRRADMEQLAADLDLAERVRFLGWRSDVRSILSTYDLFVLSTHVEGFPISLVEAVVAGLGCVATDVPGTREVLTRTDGTVCGTLVGPRDPSALVRAIETELSHASDQCAATSRSERAAELDITSTVDAYLRCYRSLLRRGDTP